MIRHIFNKASEWGWEGRNPTSGITNLHIHDLRRAVGSYEAMNGVSLPIISKTLNHKTFQAT